MMSEDPSLKSVSLQKRRKVSSSAECLLILDTPPSNTSVPHANNNSKTPNDTNKSFVHTKQSVGVEEDSDGHVLSKQVHEDDAAGLVIICEPDLPKMMGSLHPCGSLYERPVNLEKAKEQHHEFRAMMERSGARVVTVREVLKYGAERDVKARIDLEDLASQCLVYALGSSSRNTTYNSSNGGHENHKEQDNGRDNGSAQGDCGIGMSNESMQYAVSEEYKRQVLESVAVDQLIDIVLTRPTVTIVQSYRDTGFSAEYSFFPLTNIVFTRDQQIVTSKGIVMGNLRSNQRKGEAEVMRFCFKKLGLKIAGEVRAPGYLEGGDFFPAGNNLCFIGVGMRTNLEAVLQLLEEDLFGTDRVAVVVDLYDQSQDRMHLDCVFSILGRDVCLLYEGAIGRESSHRRLVLEFRRDPNSEFVALKLDNIPLLPDMKKWIQASSSRVDDLTCRVGHYECSIRRSGIPFDEYLNSNGFHIVSVSAEDQLSYGCNCLNLGNSHIVCVNNKTARDIAKTTQMKGLIEYLDFSAITSMYGAVHCGSQVLYRRPD